MAEPVASAASTAVAAVLPTTAVAMGTPPEGVLLFAFLGSIVAVWLHTGEPEPLTWKVVGRTGMLMFVSIFSGVVGSALLRGLEGAPVVGIASRIEPWITAGIVSACIHKFGPLLFKRAQAIAQKGSENAPAP